MICVERRGLLGLLRERRLFYAQPGCLTGRETRPPRNELVSLVACPQPLEAGANCVVARRQYTVCIDLRQPAEAVFKSFNATTRTAVRQSQSMQQSIEVSINGKCARHHFLELANRTRKGRGLPPSSRLNGTLERYGSRVDLWVLHHGGKAMCGHVILTDPDAGRARLLYSVSRRFEGRDEYRLCGVLNRYLHWREIEHYQSADIAAYDLGGIDDHYQESTVSHFKLSFGGAIQTEYSYLIAGMKTAGLLGVVLWQRITGHRLP
jgi:hypothetical protein